MKKITVLEDMGYGMFKTDAGTFLVDFAPDGHNQILVNEETGAGEYVIDSDERGPDDEVLAFIVK